MTPATASAELDDVLTALRGMGATDLAEVEKRVAFLRRTSEPTRNEGLDFARYVVDIIIEVLREQALPLPRTTANLASRSDWQAFSDKAQVIERYLLRSGLDRQGRVVVLKMGVRLLTKRLMAEGRQVSFNILLANAHRIPVMLNREFPGYAQAGLLHVLIGRPALTDGE